MNSESVQCDDRQLATMLRSDDVGIADNVLLEHVEHCSHCQGRLRKLAAEEIDWNRVSSALKKSQNGNDDDDSETLSRSQPRFGRWSNRPIEWNESMVEQLIEPPTHPEMLGRLGRYEIERLIGSGGMGVVFKAYDTELNRVVAIKLLAPYLANNGSARKRFAREARSAAGVVDDHVVPIHNVESENSPPFLVMQYVAGGSLQESLDQVGPLEVAEVLRIGMQTAKGLAAAHVQGLIHRDIKPSNILLDEGVERALLTDFGLARAENDASLTRSGFQPGTPHYMSPEQVRGEAIDGRSDLFGLGCVMYALCTGHPPFRADTSFAVMRRITDDEPRPIREINADIPEWLETIVLRLLEKSRDDRYESAGQVAELLEQCLAHVQQPTEVSLPESVIPKPSPKRSFFRSHKKGILAMIAFAFFGMMAGVLAQATSPPDISGKWAGDGWGIVSLNQQESGVYLGDYQDEERKVEGTLSLKWSRVERQYKGTWQEGKSARGRLTLRLDGEGIRGAVTTRSNDKNTAADALAGTPKMTDLHWQRSAGEIRAEPAASQSPPESTLAVIVTNATGEQSSAPAYLTLWRALKPGEAVPSDKVVWNDDQNKVRWIRSGKSHAGAPPIKKGYAVSYQFKSLRPGQYRVTAMSYRRENRIPDPTPFGVSDPITIDGSGVATAKVRLIPGSADVRIKVVDAETCQPVDGVALRLRASNDMPIVHGHGTGNFFEWTDNQGMVRFAHLPPGEFKVEILGKEAQVNQFTEYHQSSNPPIQVPVKPGQQKIELVLQPRQLSQAEINRRFPFSVFGRVTDTEGNPIADAEVRATTGYGTLRGGGKTTTDADGKYRLYLRGGMSGRVSKDAPHGFGVQAAQFYVDKSGWNLDSPDGHVFYLMTDKSPEAFKQQLALEGMPVWGKTGTDEVVFMNQPREINFALHRGSRGPATIGQKSEASKSIAVDHPKHPLTLAQVESQSPESNIIIRSIRMVNHSERAYHVTWVERETGSSHGGQHRDVVLQPKESSLLKVTTNDDPEWKILVRGYPTDEKRPAGRHPVIGKVSSESGLEALLPTYNGKNIRDWLEVYRKGVVQRSGSLIANSTEALEYLREHPSSAPFILREMEKRYNEITNELKPEILDQAAKSILVLAGRRHQENAIEYLFKIADMHPTLKAWNTLESGKSRYPLDVAIYSIHRWDQELAEQIVDEMTNSPRRMLGSLFVLLSVGHGNGVAERWVKENANTLHSAFQAAEDDPKTVVRELASWATEALGEPLPKPGRLEPSNDTIKKSLGAAGPNPTSADDHHGGDGIAGVHVDVLLSIDYSQEVMEKNVGIDGIGIIDRKSFKDLGKGAKAFGNCRMESFEKVTVEDRDYWRATFFIPQGDTFYKQNLKVNQQFIDETQSSGAEYIIMPARHLGMPLLTEPIWGEPVDGLQLGISGIRNQQRFDKGDLVTFGLLIRNVGTEDARFQYIVPELSHYIHPAIFTASGQRVRLHTVGFRGGVQTHAETLKPQESASLRVTGAVVLGESKPSPRSHWAVMKDAQPGQYKLNAGFFFNRVDASGKRIEKDSRLKSPSVPFHICDESGGKSAEQSSTKLSNQEGQSQRKRHQALDEAVEVARDSVVSIQSLDENKVESVGTGIIVDPRGYIATKGSLVDDKRTISVTLASHESVSAEILAIDESTGLALIKVNVDQPLPVIRQESNFVEVGTKVAIIFGAKSEKRSAIGSVLATTVDAFDHSPHYSLHFDADSTTLTGVLGAPLVNWRGEIVGIVDGQVGGPSVTAISSKCIHPLKDLIRDFEKTDDKSRVDGVWMRTLSKKTLSNSTSFCKDSTL